MTVIWLIWGLCREPKVFGRDFENNWIDRNLLLLLFPCMVVDTIVIAIIKANQ